MKPAVLSLVTPFNERYTCKEIDNVPKPFSDSLFKEECIELEYTELLQQCQQISLGVTPDECRAIEASTRKQSQSKVWYQQRAGRITASNLKSACKTNTAKPAKNLYATRKPISFQLLLQGGVVNMRAGHVKLIREKSVSPMSL